MRYHWIQDRSEQKEYDIYWEPGVDNLAYYFTKNFTPAHHKRTKPRFLTSHPQVHSVMQGCVDHTSDHPWNAPFTRAIIS